jgi:hypothetical protein
MYEKEVFKEQKRFNKRLTKLLKGKHVGKYVLFKHNKIWGYFNDVLSAYFAGILKYGTDSWFVIDRIEEKRPILCYQFNCTEGK